MINATLFISLVLAYMLTLIYTSLYYHSKSSLNATNNIIMIVTPLNNK